MSTDATKAPEPEEWKRRWSEETGYSIAELAKLCLGWNPESDVLPDPGAYNRVCEAIRRAVKLRDLTRVEEIPPTGDEVIYHVGWFFERRQAWGWAAKRYPAFPYREEARLEGAEPAPALTTEAVAAGDPRSDGGPGERPETAAGSVSAPGQQSAPIAAAEMRQLAYVFRRAGRGWEVTFGDEPLRVVEDRVGMEIVHRLLSAPGRSLEAAALLDNQRVDCLPENFTRDVRPARATLTASDLNDDLSDPGIVGEVGFEEVDDATITKAHDRLDELDEAIETASGLGKGEFIADLKKERADIQDFLKKHTYRGRIRPPKQQTANTASQAYGRTLQHLAKCGAQKLHAHLVKSIKREGGRFTYEPGTDLPWQT